MDGLVFMTAAAVLFSLMGVIWLAMLAAEEAESKEIANRVRAAIERREAVDAAWRREPSSARIVSREEAAGSVR